MAHAIMFDTLYYANKLKAAGIPAEQAEVQAETLAEIIDETEQHICTKIDLEKMQTETKIEFQSLRSELRNEIYDVKMEVGQFRADMNVKFAEVYKAIAENKNELIKWGISISFGQAALIISVLKLLH